MNADDRHPDRLPDELQDPLDEEFARLRASEQADEDARRATRGLGWVLLAMVALVIGGVSVLFGADPGTVGLVLAGLVAALVLLRLAHRRQR